MKFVTFINDATREPVAINPATVSMVGPVKRADVVAPACLLTIADGRTPVYVAGTFAEVVAALESATTSPVAAAVEVAPTDLEMAAKVLELFARDHIVWEPIDLALGLDPEVGWDDTRGALITLAAKLRGGG